eukprot:UN34504
MEIWSSNNLLVIHLKRFKYTRYSRDKITRDVIFPVRGLDISRWLVNDEVRNTDKCIYDLYGVSMHSGGLHGGHYVAAVKNFKDQKWYNCNDQFVDGCSPESIDKSDAYLLFYH